MSCLLRATVFEVNPDLESTLSTRKSVKMSKNNANNSARASLGYSHSSKPTGFIVAVLKGGVLPEQLGTIPHLDCATTRGTNRFKEEICFAIGRKSTIMEKCKSGC